MTDQVGPSPRRDLHCKTLYIEKMENAAKKIGVLEDDPAIRGMLSELLELAGHVPALYADGWDFLAEIVEDEQTPKHPAFDVVLIDLALPSISGVQVTHTVTTLLPDLPIIIISAARREYLDTVKRRYPRVHILQKPFSIHDLLTIIQTS